MRVSEAARVPIRQDPGGDAALLLRPLGDPRLPGVPPAHPRERARRRGPPRRRGQGQGRLLQERLHADANK